MNTPRINALRSLILQAKTAYYYSSNPIMSDNEYDALEDELRTLSPDDDVLALVGSPVPMDTMLTKANHSMPMGSQSKVNSIDEFRAWCIKNNNLDIHASLKGDGASAAGYYINGRLMQAISRGDGIVGEDITVNAMKFKGLPAFAGDANGGFTGSVRFEVILTIEDWARVDPLKSKNPRNVGTGIAGRKNSSQSELLTIFAFDIDENINGVQVNWETECQKTERLAELGFNVIPHQRLTSMGEAIAYFNAVDAGRQDLPIWIDGVVMKCNSIAKQKELGVTSGRPKGQIAWKFGASGTESILESVVISGGHTGGLYPTAQFRPVEIGGTTVSSASLANFDEIERLGLAIGDSILVVKANDIIPKIIEVTHRPNDRTMIQTPTCCPFCNGEVGRKQNTGGDIGVILMCKNPDCSKKSTGKIGRWISSLDILGIGDTLLEALIERFDLADAADLYTLHTRKDDLAQLVVNVDRDLRLGQKRATSILEAIDAKRNLSLPEFLGSLGLEFLGKRRVEIMIKSAGTELSTLPDWRSGKLRSSSLAAMAGAPNMGDSIANGLDDMSNLIDKMLASGVTIKAEKAPSHSDEADVTLKTVCISGKLTSGKKKSDYEQPLKESGFELLDDVVKGLTYLVLADPMSTSSKSQKAKKLGVEIISEEQMIALTSLEC